MPIVTVYSPTKRRFKRYGLEEDGKQKVLDLHQKCWTLFQAEGFLCLYSRNLCTSSWSQGVGGMDGNDIVFCTDNISEFWKYALDNPRGRGLHIMKGDGGICDGGPGEPPGDPVQALLPAPVPCGSLHSQAWWSLCMQTREMQPGDSLGSRWLYLWRWS